MTKEEIITRIKYLQICVKSPGRSYTREQRNGMRVEIGNLSIELDAINLNEDIAYIKEIQPQYATLITSVGEELKNKIDNLSKSINDNRIEFAMKCWFDKFNNILHQFNACCQGVNTCSEAISYLNKNEPIPSSNSKRGKSKDEICRTLAKFYRGANDTLSELRNVTNDIDSLLVFFEKETLNGFVYLKNAVFSEASDFSKGYAIVAQGSRKMYLEHNGDLYKIEFNENLLNKINITNTNPDLVPFEIWDENYGIQMGYKNSNGEVIINPIYKLASPFVNGFAKVGVIKEDSPILYGLIDFKGNIVLLCDFLELEDVYNEIVVYKRPQYSEGYERTSSWNFNMKYIVKNLGLFSGYLKFSEIKTAIYNEIEILFQLQKSMSDITTNDEIEEANAKTKAYKERIDYYLRYIIERKRNSFK